MSNQNTSVSFKVADNGLEAYMANVQKKSLALSNDAIKAAISQTEKGKELLDIINKQIKAYERKAQLENQISSSGSKAKIDEINKKREENIAFLEQKKRENNTNYGNIDSRIKGTNEAADARISEVRRDQAKEVASSKDRDKEIKLQSALAKEQLEAIKSTAKENIKAINNGDLKLVDVIRNASTDEEKLVSKLTQEGVEKEKKQQTKEGGGAGIMTSLLSMDNLSKFVSTASQITQTQNGFDQIGNSGRAISTVIGTALGAIVGSIVPGLGTVAGAAAGGSIANLIGGTASDFVQRQAIAKQEFLRSSYRFGALTGGEPGAFENTAGIGVSGTQFLQSQYEFAKRRGNSASSRKTALDALYAERGFGVDSNTSAGLIEIQRSSRENNKDLAGLIGGVLAKGHGTYFKNNDSTFLGEFLQKFTVLQRELLKTNSTTGTAGTYSILEKFNSLGGAFATSDPRSGGLINTVNSSLANPSGDFRKALSFYALRKNNPNMSLVELIEEQQKGLGSSNYLNSVLSMIDGGSGDDSAKKLNAAGFLGLENNQAFASQLYSGYKSGKLKGPFASGELSGLYDFKGRAEENTNDPDKNAARISNALLGELSDALESMVGGIQNAVKDAFSGSVIELDNGKLLIPLSKATIQKNATTAANERQRLDAILPWQMQNQVDARKNGGVHHK